MWISIFILLFVIFCIAFVLHHNAKATQIKEPFMPTIGGIYPDVETARKELKKKGFYE